MDMEMEMEGEDLQRRHQTSDVMEWECRGLLASIQCMQTELRMRAGGGAWRNLKISERCRILFFSVPAPWVGIYRAGFNSLLPARCGGAVSLFSNCG